MMGLQPVSCFTLKGSTVCEQLEVGGLLDWEVTSSNKWKSSTVAGWGSISVGTSGCFQPETSDFQSMLVIFVRPSHISWSCVGPHVASAAQRGQPNGVDTTTRIC